MGMDEKGILERRITSCVMPGTVPAGTSIGPALTGAELDTGLLGATDLAVAAGRNRAIEDKSLL